MNYYWLSFRDPEKNLNLGCVIIKDSSDIDDALKKSQELGINLGGEVYGESFAEEEFQNENLESNKLYSRNEMIERGYKLGL